MRPPGQAATLECPPEVHADQYSLFLSERSKRRRARACLGPGCGRSSALVSQLALELPDSSRGAPRRPAHRRSRRTAQPGSVSWPQSLNRHRAASSAMSENASSTPASAPQSPSSRIPGCRGRVRRTAAAQTRGGSSCGGPSSPSPTLPTSAVPPEQTVEATTCPRRTSRATRRGLVSGQVLLEPFEPDVVQAADGMNGDAEATASTAAMVLSSSSERSLLLSTITG